MPCGRFNLPGSIRGALDLDAAVSVFDVYLDAGEIEAGTLIRLASYQNDFIATDKPDFDHGTRPVPVAQVNNYAQVWRSAEGPRDGLGQPEAGMVMVSEGVALVCQNNRRFYVAPTVDIQQGNQLHLSGGRYLVLGTRQLSPHALAELMVEKQIVQPS
jgi:hypothetical protein